MPCCGRVRRWAGDGHRNGFRSIAWKLRCQLSNGFDAVSSRLTMRLQTQRESRPSVTRHRFVDSASFVRSRITIAGSPVTLRGRFPCHGWCEEGDLKPKKRR
jgi:hypothetical protein